MVTPKERRSISAFLKRTAITARKVDRLEARQVRNLDQILGTLEERLNARLGGTEFNRFQTQNIRRTVGTAVDDLTAELARKYGEESPELAKLARELISKAGPEAATQAQRLGTPLVTSEDLQRAAAFTAEKIQNLGDQAKQQISNTITTGIFTGQNREQIMKDLRQSGWIKPLKVKGRKIGVAARVENIVRTETNRFFNTANKEEAEDLKRTQNVTLKKTWITSGDFRVRPSHVRVGQVYAITKPAGISKGQWKGPIPIGEKFKVGGQLASHPQDPSLTAGETVNCRCTMVTLTPEMLERSGV